MYPEIQTTIGFLSSYLFTKIPRRKVNLFGEQLANYLILKFQNHWYPRQPSKGSAFRCIRIGASGLTDAMVGTAAESVGIELEELLQHLPPDLTLWVDPGEVTYRSGEFGKVNLLYSLSNGIFPVTPLGSTGRFSDSSTNPHGTHHSANVNPFGHHPSLPGSHQSPESHGFGSVNPLFTAVGNKNASLSGFSLATPNNANAFGYGVESSMPTKLPTTTIPEQQQLYPSSYQNQIIPNAAQLLQQQQYYQQQQQQHHQQQQQQYCFFESAAPNDLKFTVGQFAMTRFGTTKLKSAAISPCNEGDSPTIGTSGATTPVNGGAITPPITFQVARKSPSMFSTFSSPGYYETSKSGVQYLQPQQPIGIDISSPYGSGGSSCASSYTGSTNSSGSSGIGSQQSRDSSFGSANLIGGGSSMFTTRGLGGKQSPSLSLRNHEDGGSVSPMSSVMGAYANGWATPSSEEYEGGLIGDLLMPNSSGGTSSSSVSGLGGLSTEQSYNLLGGSSCWAY